MQRFSPERLRSARQATGLRPEASAVAVDRSAITVRFWETGRSVPNANQLAALAELYGTYPSAFYVSDLVGGLVGERFCD